MVIRAGALGASLKRFTNEWCTGAVYAVQTNAEAYTYILILDRLFMHRCNSFLWRLCVFHEPGVACGSMQRAVNFEPPCPGAGTANESLVHFVLSSRFPKWKKASCFTMYSKTHSPEWPNKEDIHGDQ